MTATARILIDLSEVRKIVDTWKGKGEKIVFTNGVFDLVHPGHIQYLEEAAALGDRLVVGINSDASVRSLEKGPGRPINDEQARATVVAGLRSVDRVVLFDGATPIELITLVMPDVLVKGGDYSVDQIVGAKEVMENGGDVKQLSFVAGHSTTAIEQKIRKAGLGQ